MRRRLTPLLATVAATLAIAAPAGAAAPLNVGTGKVPVVAMDPAGTAFIAWQTDTTIGFCRLPRRAQACDARAELPFAYEFSGGHRLHLVRRDDGALLLVLSRNREASSGETVLFASADAGASWSGPAVIAGGSYGFDHVALTGDGGSLMTVSGSIDRLTFQRTPLGGGETRTLELGDGLVADPDVMTLPDGRVLLVWYHSGEGIGWRVFGGGDPFDVNAWGAPRLEPSSGGQPLLVKGRRGVFLLYQRSSITQNVTARIAPWALRSFDAKRNRWRAPRQAGGDRFVYGDSDFEQDAGGRLHIASATAGGPTKWGCVVYTRTGRRSSQWFGPTTVLFRTRDPQRLPSFARLGVAADGKGIVAWTDKQDGIWVQSLKQKPGRARTLAAGRKPNCERL
jgi:hypothetical protein